MAEMDEPQSPWDEQNVKQAQLLVLLQIRDFLGGILSQSNPAGYAQVREAHDRGELALPPPKFGLTVKEEGE